MQEEENLIKQKFQTFSGSDGDVNEVTKKQEFTDEKNPLRKSSTMEERDSNLGT